MFSRLTRSLRARLLLVVLTTVLCSMALLVADAVQQRRRALDRASEEAIRTARIAVDLDRQSLDGAQQLLTSLVHTGEVQERRSLAAARLFRMIDREDNPYDGIAAARPDGALFASSTPPLDRRPLADRDWFTRALETRRMTVSAVRPWPTTGLPTFQCALAAYDSVGHPRAVVFTNLDLGGFDQLSDDGRLPKHASLRLLNVRGETIATWPRGARTAERPLLSPEEIRRVLSGRSLTRFGADPADPTRLDAFAALARPEERGLIVAVGLPGRELLAASRRDLALNLLALTLVAIALVVLAFRLLRETVLEPLRRLVAATRRVRQGDLANRVAPVEAAGEIGALARAFDEMTTALARQRQSEQLALTAMRTSEARKAAVLSATFDGLVTFDANGLVLEFNPAAERMFLYPARSVIGRPFADLVLPSESWNEFLKQRRGVRRTTTPLRTTATRADLSDFPVEVSIAECASATGERLFVATIRDVTERQKYEEALRVRSLTDDLTGLLNRRGFHLFSIQALRSARRAGGQVTTLFFDLDRFKAINDSLGHAAGDRALVTFARALRATFRDSDVIARMGGDEFVVLALDASDPAALLERLTEVLAARAQDPDGIAIRFSVGFATRPAERLRSAETLGELLDAADHSLYASRRDRSPGSPSSFHAA